MAATEFVTPHLGQMSVEELGGSPGEKPLSPLKFRQFLNLLSQDMNRFGVDSVTLTGTYQLTRDSKVILKLDPGGAGRTVRLPEIANVASTSNIWFLIANGADAAESLAVKSWNGTAEGSTIVTIAQDEAAIVGLDGGSWVKIATIAITI